LRFGKLHAALSGCHTAGDDTVRVARLVKLAPLMGRVLVVEDQELNREVAEGMLAAIGVDSDTARDGHEALEKLARERFDAVLMDCEMPLMDGFAATRALRQREAGGPRVPVIALTADATHAGRTACLAAGMDDYLAKPVTRETLHATLARWLAAPQLPAGSAATRAVAATPSDPVPAQASGAEEAAQDARLAQALLDHTTLAALRALPPRGERDMLSHIAESYLLDSQRLLADIERALDAGEGPELARAAHAWRSCNGHVGALGLASLCRELEACGRAGDLRSAPALLAQVRSVYARVRAALQGEMRRSA